jgi:hypothetical protein
MSSINDPMTEAERAVLHAKLIPVREALAECFGWTRAEVLFTTYCAAIVAGALTVDRRAYRHVLTTLNEGWRDDQLNDHTEAGGDAADFRPWVLVPVQEP